MIQLLKVGGGSMQMRLAWMMVTLATAFASSAALAQMSDRSMSQYLERLHNTNGCSSGNKGNMTLVAVVEGLPDNHAAFYFTTDASPGCTTPAGGYRAACEKVSGNRWFCTHSKATGSLISE
jgi:hypothetical protein